MAESVDHELDYWKNFFKSESPHTKLEFWLILCIKKNINTLQLITNNPCATIMKQGMSFQDIKNAIKHLEDTDMIIKQERNNYALAPELNYRLAYLLYKIPKLNTKSDIEQTIKSMKECKIVDPSNYLGEILNNPHEFPESQKSYKLLDIGVNNAIPFFIWMYKQISSL